MLRRIHVGELDAGCEDLILTAVWLVAGFVR